MFVYEMYKYDFFTSGVSLINIPKALDNPVYYTNTLSDTKQRWI